MASGKLLSSAARAELLTPRAGLLTTRAGLLATAPRAALPIFGAEPLSAASRGIIHYVKSIGNATTIEGHGFSIASSAGTRGLFSAPRPALPFITASSLSSVPRGSLSTFNSIGKAITVQGPTASGIRLFSSGKMPPWMADVHRDSPAKTFRDLDWHGQSTVILCYQVIQEKGDQIEGAISKRMQAMEEALVVKIGAVPDKIKVKLDRFTMERAFKITRQVFYMGFAIYLYFVGAEFASRCLEALGQMRKHAPEIVSDFVAACKDDVMFFPFNMWPFNKHRKFNVKDDWWIDPEKQAIRDKAEAEKLARRAKRGIKAGEGKKQ